MMQKMAHPSCKDLQNYSQADSELKLTFEDCSCTEVTQIESPILAGT